MLRERQVGMFLHLSAQCLVLLRGHHSRKASGARGGGKTAAFPVQPDIALYTGDTHAEPLGDLMLAHPLPHRLHDAFPQRFWQVDGVG